MPLPFVLLAAVWAVTLCAEDLKSRRIPNAGTFGGLLVFLVFHLGYGGRESLITAFAASVLAGGFLLLPWLMRAAGGGDVKMLAAAGAAVGPSGVVPLLYLTSISGLLVALVWLLAGRADPARLRHVGRSLFDPRYDRAAAAAVLPPRGTERMRVPFSIAIALGMFGSFWSQMP